MKNRIFIITLVLALLNIVQFDRNRVLKERHQKDIMSMAVIQYEKEQEYNQNILNLFETYNNEITKIEEGYNYDIEKINEDFNNYIDGDFNNGMLIKRDETYRCNIYTKADSHTPESSNDTPRARTTVKLSEEVRYNLRRLARDADLDRANLNQCKRYIKEINNYIDEYNQVMIKK